MKTALETLANTRKVRQGKRTQNGMRKKEPPDHPFEQKQWTTRREQMYTCGSSTLWVLIDKYLAPLTDDTVPITVFVPKVQLNYGNCDCIIGGIGEMADLRNRGIDCAFDIGEEFHADSSGGLMYGMEPCGEGDSTSRCAIGGVAAPRSIENDVTGVGVVTLLGVLGGVGICPNPALQLVASANTLPDPVSDSPESHNSRTDQHLERLPHVAWKSEGKPKLLVGIATTWEQNAKVRLKQSHPHCNRLVKCRTVGRVQQELEPHGPQELSSLELVLVFLQLSRAPR